MQASQLLEWVRTHRWCGACGVPTMRVPGERAMQCPRCGLRNYPRISPAMMVLVTRGHELLLASNVNFPPGRYSARRAFWRPVNRSKPPSAGKWPRKWASRCIARAISAARAGPFPIP
ncbi:NADH pyrophosphatase zinc ribbon domain-containing protein [Lautropia mirabilis]